MYTPPSGYATLEGNTVYGNALGGVYMTGGSSTGNAVNQVINNLIEANGGAGIVVSGVSGSTGIESLIENNTIVSTLYTGTTANGTVAAGLITDAILVLGTNTPAVAPFYNSSGGQLGSSSSNLEIENNILDVSSGGYAIQVAQGSEQNFKSDYNLFMLRNGSQVAYWENLSFANQTNWYYEVGFDQHSQMANAAFVNLSANANGAIGWDNSQVTGSAVNVDTSSPTYSQSGSWTAQGTGAGGSSAITPTLNGPVSGPVGNATQSADGQTSATTASWTFNGLSAGYYEVAVTWQQPYYTTLNGTTYGYVTSNASYTAYDGTTVVGTSSVNQESTLTAGDAAGDFSANGSVWHSTMLVQISGASLTVVLDNVANQSFVRADGVRLVRLSGALTQNTDAHLQAGSPAIAAGDPATPVLSEPLPNGDRVDIGAYGDTSQSTASTNPLIQVLNPGDLAKVQVGSTVSVDLRSAGLLPYDELAKIAPGSGNTTGTNADGWSYQNYRNDANGSSYYTTTSGTINLNPPAPTAVGTVNAITGSGTNGTYTNVVLTGATGSGAQATVVVAGGVVTTVTVTSAGGGGYTIGESLSFTISGGSGTCKVATNVANAQYLVANTAPASVYSDLAYAPGGVGTQMSFQLPVTNGTYQLVLDFVEPYSYMTAGQRQFDIVINGVTVASNVDVFALAGGYNKAVSLSFAAVASGGQGISLVLKNDSASGYGAIISGIEIRHANAQGVAAPQVNLQLSTDGGITWNTTIATGVTLDQYGNGVFNWMPTANEITSGNTAYIRATASLDGVTTAATGTSSPFLIASNGPDYYVSVTGNDANSGKDPADPMASLPALLRAYAYTLSPGDIIYVGPGTYTLATNVVLTAADDGVIIQGSTTPGQPTIFNRGNENAGAYVFEFNGATGVTLNNVNATGAQTGIYSDAIYASPAQGITVANSNIYGNYADGIEINSGYPGSGADFTLMGSTVHNNGSYGVYLYAGGDTVESSQIYGNTQWGISAQSTNSANPDQILNNLIHDNAGGGITAASYVQITGNEVYGHTTGSAIGINLSNAGDLASDNKVYKNFTGISVQYGAIASGNYVYSNTSIGIAVYDATVTGNHVFSNPTGVSDTGYSEIDNNVVYANANVGLAISGGHNGQYVRDNTIYQPGGDGVQIAASSSGVLFYNNIVQVNAGTALKVGASQTGFASDFNLFYTPIAGAQVGVWSGVQEATLAAWQAASAQDAHSKTGNPLFLDPAGADQILGDQGVNTGNGFDDNFGLAAGSPAINAGDQLIATLTDINGNPRHTDPGTPDTGVGDPIYVPAVQTGSTFNATGGTALSYNQSQGGTAYVLPFAFSFYGVSYTQVYISPDGFLQFAGPDSVSSPTNSVTGLQKDVRIAPFWANLTTYNGTTSLGAFADTTVAGQVTIRWAGLVTGTSDPVNFSVTLFQNGSFRFDYGVCPVNVVAPTVGVGAGNGQVYVLSSYNGEGNLSGAASVLWTTTASLTSDIGAYEYQGNSSDTTPPQVTTVSNLPPSGGTTALAFTSVQVNFTASLDQISARSPDNYILVYAPGGVLGAPDNTQILLTPEYSYPQSSVTLQFTNGVLKDGLYELIVQGIYDINGNLLLGNGAGSVADQYVVTFTIDRSHNVPPVASSGTATVAENQSVTITLSSTDPGGEPLTFSIVGAPLHGTLSAVNETNDTVVYTPTANYNGTDTFMFQVDDGKLGISDATVSLTVTPVNQQPVSPGTTAQTNENTPVEIFLPASDVETAQPNLTYNVVQPANGTLTPAGGGQNGLYIYTPNPYFYGTDTFTYTVTDRGDPDGSYSGVLTSIPGTVTVAVAHVNQPPAIAPIGTTIGATPNALAVNEGTALNFTVVGTDPDSVPLLYSLINNTVSGASINASTGAFTWTPPAGPTTQSFTVQVLAYGTLAAQETFNVIVAHVPPSLTLTGAATIRADQTYSVTFGATEAVSAHTVSSWSINWGDGTNSVLAGTATGASHVYVQKGLYDVVATATDDVGSYVSQPLAVQVTVPVLSGASPATYTQGGAAVTASSGITVTDVGSATLASASVSIGAGFFSGDVLGAVTTGTLISVSYNAATGVLTLTGSDTLANYQAVLDSVTFSSTSANPTNYGANMSRTLSWQISDGTLNSNPINSTVAVVGVDQAPVLTGAGNTVTFTQGGAAVVASPAIAASDVDSLNLASATVSISTGFLAGDVLGAVTTGTSISASYNTSTGVLSLSGSDTVAHYQTVLDAVTFSSGSANPTNTGADPSRTITWQVNDGALASNTLSSNVSVVALAVAPLISGAGNTVTFTQGGGAIATSPGITLTDVDSLTLASATVSIGTGFLAGDALAAVTTLTSISASYNAGTGVLTLSGSDTLAHYQTVLDSVTFNSTSANPTSYGSDVSRALSWQVNDGALNSNTVASTVTVVGVDQAPVLAGAGNTVTFTQGGAPVTASPAILVSDVDSLNLASASVSIGTGFFAGDTLAALTAGTSITATYNAGTGVLSLSGSDT